KAILRGTGELEGETLEEVVYEGYGPGGVALIIEVITDNRNRTIAAVRHTLSKFNGRIGERGCVAWGFDKCGLIVVDADSIDEEELFLVAADAGAEDLTPMDDTIEIITPFEQFDKVVTAIQSTDASIQLAEVSMIPQNTVRLEGKEAERMLRLMVALDELDDVQKIYANFDIPDDILEAAA
ncbi:MAG: YebC/PmpR family DNA-binding transcriptional regulator, partial [Candidatus Poribacteria bacterium]|nr:YebC/PmpR family DNA-binding transcriptional regulator [Candidatus Poribacteria bacterium]